jgi:hypothetical protein
LNGGMDVLNTVYPHFDSRNITMDICSWLCVYFKPTIAMFLFYVISPVIVGTLFSGTISLQI